MTDWGQVAIAAIVAVPATIGAWASLKNGAKMKEATQTILHNTAEKFKNADAASVRRTAAVVQKLDVAEIKLDDNTVVSTQAKDQATESLSVANGNSAKFFAVHQELARLRDQNVLQEERIERHRLANIAQVELFRKALEALEALQPKPTP